MIRFYKGNLIVITRGINGKGSFKVSFKLYYRYRMFRFKRYDNSVTLNDNLTVQVAYDSLKEFIDNLDNVIKLK